MGRILSEIRQQENEIYAKYRRYCDTVVLGTKQLAQLRFQEFMFIDYLYGPETKVGMPLQIEGLEIREHPFFDGVLVLPKEEKIDMPLELTAEEEQLILKMRSEEALKKQARERALRRIRTAHGYALWLEANGAGDTYSTFCDGFGYEAKLGESRSETWHTISDIWEVVGLR